MQNPAPTSSPIRVGIIGQGRSGWGIHADFLRKVPELFRVEAVADLIPERVAQSAAELGCRAYPDAESLIADPNLDLVVVSTFNYTHARYAAMALRAGHHVLCEKPFGLTVADVDDMMAAARESGRVLAPFQQRRYERDFLKLKEVVDSGILGDIVHIRICWHGFGRRWDWQTSRAFAGGNLNNNGPHPLDHALELFGPAEPEVWAQAGGYLRSGDAEDHLKFILSAPGSPTVEVELTSVWAYPQDRWVVAGTRGGLHGNVSRLDWKWVDFSTMPERPLDTRPTPDRSYNHEDLEWHADFWEAAPGSENAGAGAAPPVDTVRDFYLDFHESLTTGRPLKITAESVRRRVATMEKIRAAAGFPAKA